MFAASELVRRVEKGQAVEGTIVAIGAEVVFVNIGGKGEASIALDELKTDAGAVDFKVGDRIQATVVSTGGEIVLSRKLQRGAATLRQIEDAYRAGLPVEGLVAGVIKGGFEVAIARQRAFCPISQIDIVRDTDPVSHIGRVYTFRIVECKEGGRNLVVSRRAVQEEERKAGAEEARKKIVVGAVLNGRVVSIRDFGAFVDLGAGVQGLIHVSEMGWARVADPTTVLTPGQDVEVKVLRVDALSPALEAGETQKIALGLKQLAPDPWESAASHYDVGQVKSGRVTRHAEFGAFVEFEPGVEGLAHVSTFPPAGNARAWTRAVPIGKVAAFEILSIDPGKRRIGVSLVTEGSGRLTPQEAADDAREAPQPQAPAESFGSLADKLRDVFKGRE